MRLEEPVAVRQAPPGSEGQEPCAMKLVSCIIRPESLEVVTTALNTLQGVGGITLTDVRGFGRQRGQIEHYRGEAYTIRFLQKVKVEVAIRDEDVERVVTAIGQAARTGQVGDGKIFVLDLRTAMRIRTGDRGATAL